MASGGPRPVDSVWRRTLYTEQDAQAVSALIEALQQKYGTPQRQATGSHLRINDGTAGRGAFSPGQASERHPVQ